MLAAAMIVCGVSFRNAGTLVRVLETSAYNDSVYEQGEASWSEDKTRVPLDELEMELQVGPSVAMSISYGGREVEVYAVDGGRYVVKSPATAVSEEQYSYSLDLLVDVYSILGSIPSDTVFEVSYSYDSYGRVAKVRYKGV